MSIISMTMHQFVLQVGERTVTVGGDYLVTNGFQAMLYSFPMWDPPHENEAVTEDERSDIVRLANEGLRERGMSVEWDETKPNPKAMAYILSGKSSTMEGASPIERTFSADIRGSRKIITVQVDVATAGGTPFEELDGKAYTVHMRRKWNDGTSITDRELADIVTNRVKEIVPPAASLINIVYDHAS
jgi:hypothetical protein